MRLADRLKRFLSQKVLGLLATLGFNVYALWLYRGSGWNWPLAAVVIGFDVAALGFFSAKALQYIAEALKAKYGN